MDFDRPFDPLPFLLVMLASLAVGWWAVRRSAALGGRGAARPGEAREAKPWMWGLATLLAALGSWPLWVGWPSFAAADGLLPGDASAHARVALELARDGRAWIESYNGGFPFGLHYQSLALLLSGALVRTGLPAATAIWVVGLGAALLFPPIFVLTARAAGAEPGGAVVGAWLLSWMSPSLGYAGGPGVMLAQGLVSQSVGMLVLLVTTWQVLARGGRHPMPVSALLGALAMAAHAQLSVCALLVAFPAALLFADRVTLRRLVFAASGAGLCGVATYLPGVLTMAVPFSWARVPAFAIVGFGPERLPEWLLGGKLLDAGRFPTLSALVWVSLAALALRLRSRPAACTLSMAGLSIAVAVGGPALATMGSPGRLLVEVFSPVRMLCLVPLLLAFAVSIAFREWGALCRAAGWVSVGRAFRRQHVAATVGALLWLVSPGPEMRGLLSAWVDGQARLRADACRREAWDGFAATAIRFELGSPSGGRFLVHEATPRIPCPVRHGLELLVRDPLGSVTGGPGSQLGVLNLAFERLRTAAGSSAEWAEALGVRRMLHRSEVSLEPDGTWRNVVTAGRATLSERIGGTDSVGLGCVREQWSGADRALRDALFEDLAGPAPRALRPGALIRLDAGEGPLVKQALAEDECSPVGASVAVTAAEPGVRRARVRSEHPVDVVVRSTYFPSWTLTVDGLATKPFRVAPGFLAVRVPAGTHELEARVAALPAQGLLLLGALLGILALAWVERRLETRPPRPSQGPAE